MTQEEWFSSQILYNKKIKGNIFKANNLAHNKVHTEDHLPHQNSFSRLFSYRSSDRMRKNI